MIIASPWSRGGRICSEVFDHTSTLQFLEHFINKKYHKKLRVSNISNWRRTICGDLTSAFKKYEEGDKQQLKTLDRDPFIKKIYGAQFKENPKNYKDLTDQEIDQINVDPLSSPYMPVQEPGTRRSCGLPYELYVNGKLDVNKKVFELKMKAGNNVFGNRSAGAPFKVYAPGDYLTEEGEEKREQKYEAARAWDYAVVAGDELAETYPLTNFKDGHYFLRIYGPNGFFRELKGNQNDPAVSVECNYQKRSGRKNKLTGNIALRISNQDSWARTITITDKSYKKETLVKEIPAKSKKEIILDLQSNYNWYNFTVEIKGDVHFSRQYAGRVETGEEGVTDPVMGRVI